MVQVQLAILFLPGLLSEAGAASGRISVELIDATGMSSRTMEELKREVEAIYESGSVQIDWSSESMAQLPERAARAYIVQRLPAMLETRLRAFRGRRPMAASLGRTGSETNQAIYVSLAAVSANAASGSVLSPELLGRALGRVLAHELAHRFLSRDHSPVGVLKESLLPSDLTGSGNDLRFTNEQLTVLRRVARPVTGAVAPK